LQLDPKLIAAHINLGSALQALNRPEEAIEQYQHALRLNPEHATAYGGLGQVLLAVGRFPEAQAATRRCLGLLPKNHPLRAEGARQLHRCEDMLALDGRLPAVLQGEDKPANAAEQFQFAELCSIKKQYAAAARLYADALAANPRSADDLKAARRYNAACSAALAAAGQGADATTIDAKDRTHLRGQALDWLRADLAAWTKAPNRAQMQSTLQHWQHDPDLAGVRDQEALAKLPATEREAWTRFWSDVANLLQKNSRRK
jgi:serine/threonine-protein kinase